MLSCFAHRKGSVKSPTIFYFFIEAYIIRSEIYIYFDIIKVSSKKKSICYRYYKRFGNTQSIVN